MDHPDPAILQEQLARIERDVARWVRKPASNRKRLILTGYRRAASRLRQQLADMGAYPHSPKGLTLAAAGQPPEIGTATSPSPYRVFQLIRNPAADSVARDRRLSRAALRLVDRDEK